MAVQCNVIITATVVVGDMSIDQTLSIFGALITCSDIFFVYREKTFHGINVIATIAQAQTHGVPLDLCWCNNASVVTLVCSGGWDTNTKLKKLRQIW